MFPLACFHPVELILINSYINSNYYSLVIMHKLISLKHIFVSSVSPKQQKRVQITKYSEPPCPNSPKLCFPVFHRYRSSNCADLQPSSTSDSERANTEVMPIPVSEELRLWLHERNLQGFIKVKFSSICNYLTNTRIMTYYIF